MEYAAIKKEIESTFNRATSLVNYGAYVDCLLLSGPFIPGLIG